MIKSIVSLSILIASLLSITAIAQIPGYPTDVQPNITKYLGLLYPGGSTGATGGISDLTNTSLEDLPQAGGEDFYGIQREPLAQNVINVSTLWIVDPDDRYGRMFSLSVPANSSVLLELTPNSTGVLRMFRQSSTGSLYRQDIDRINAGYTYIIWSRVGLFGENEVWYTVNGFESNHIWLNAFEGWPPLRYNESALIA